MFQALFKELDSDFDNLITADAIDITTLPIQTVKLLKPLFTELDQIEEGIDQAEFIEAVERLYQVSLPLC